MKTFKEELEEFRRKVKICDKRIADIELISDKSRRQEWRDLKRFKNYAEDKIKYLEYQISIGHNTYEEAGWKTMNQN